MKRKNPRLHTEDSSSNHGKVVELSQKAHSLFKEKQYSLAYTLFIEAQALEPHNPYVLIGLGDTLRMLKNYPNAAQCYQKILDKNPENLFALRGLGDTYRSQRLHKKALLLWERYIQFRPSDIFVLTRIADGHKSIGEHQQALVFYHKVLSINKGDHYALMGLADLYQKTGQDDLAIQYYEQILHKNPQLINILTIVGNLYRRQGKHEKSREYYEKALTLEDTNTYALYGLGHYYRWLKDYPTAISLWEKIPERERNVDLLTRLADAYRSIGNLAAAEGYYRKNLDNNYDKFSLMGLAKVYTVRGEINEVTNCYRQLVTKEKEDGHFFAEIALHMIKCNRQNEVLSFYKTACALQKSDQDICKKLANHLEEFKLPFCCKQTILGG